MKITVIGAGNVGATCAAVIAEKEICNQIVLIDIKKGLAEGKALDMEQTAPLARYTTKISGVTDDYSLTKDSSIVVITSGIPRKPGMTRDDLIATNAEIVKSVTENSIKYSPNAIYIVVSNPLDVMAYTCLMTAKIDPHKVIGMAGMLDNARFKTFIANELNCSAKDIMAITLGGHGDTMVPLPRFTTVSGVPVLQLMAKEKLDKIIERTRFGGGEIVELLGTSAWYAPGYAAAKMAALISKNQRRYEPASAFLNGEYGYHDMFFGVPVMLGKNGVEQILEIDLNEEERQEVDNSAVKVKETIDVLKKLYH